MCTFCLVKNNAQHAYPHSGIVFLEMLSIKSMEDLRRGLESWLSTRAADDYTWIPVEGEKLPEKREKVTHKKGQHGSSCNVCDKIGDNAKICWFKPRVNRSSSSGSRSSAKTVTCFTCKKELT